MTIDEFKKKYGLSSNPHSEWYETYSRMNSVYLVNNIPVDILFIGDSITQSFEVNAYFKRYGTVVNRGIGGETTDGLIERFERDALDLHPKICVAASGVNDLYPLFKRVSEGEALTDIAQSEIIEKIVKNYSILIKKAKNSNTKLYFCSILPLGVSDFRNALIVKINAKLKELCSEGGIKYIDYHSRMVKKDGVTLLDVTFGDDLHPHVAGYNIMAECLYPELDKEF